MKTRMKRTLSLILVACIILMLIPYSAASAITLSSNAVQMVSAGGSHTLMIRNDGTLWAWGLNGNGQLGDGTTTNRAVPTPVGTDTDWAYVSAGGYHSLALKTDGSLWSWGSNAQGQLGRTVTGSNNTTPVQVGSTTGWGSISAGSIFSMAIDPNGYLFAWGDNGSGQLGIGGTTQQNAPVQVGSATWSRVSAGGYWVYMDPATAAHAAGIQSDGTLWTWGANSAGQLGRSTSPTDQPGSVNGDTDWVSLSAGCWTVFAIKTNGSLYGWGGNGQGQVGNNSTANVTAPVQIGTGFSSVSAGRYHTMGITTVGALYGWGRNDEGWLGNGTSNSTSAGTIPTQIGTNTNWISVSAAWYHTAAVKNDGSLWTAGSNGALQLGNGDTNTGNDVYTLSLIQPSIAIVTDPANASVTSGQSASLSVTAIGSLTSGSLAYQWHSTPDGTVTSGVPITDGTGTGASFTTPALTDTTGLGTAYYYYVVVSDPNTGGAAPVTSAVATVTVRQAETTASPIDLSTLTAGNWGAGWSFDGTVLTIDAGATVSLTGTAPAGTRIVVQGPTPANVTFDNVTIPDPGDGTSSPLTLASGAVLNLTEAGTNSLTSYSSAPTIAVPSDAALNIIGDGILNANNYGTSGGVGIGGSTPAGVLTMSGSPIVFASGVDMTPTSSSNGILFDGTAGTVYGSPTTTTDWTIPNDATLDIPAGAALNVGAGTTLTNDGDIENDGILNVLGTLDNYNTLNNNSDGALTVADIGTLVNTSTITNSGIMTVASGGLLDNWATITNNDTGTITVDAGGELQNGARCTINNNNILNINGSLDNYGTLNSGTGSSAATITIGDGGILTNTSSGTIDNGADGTLANDGTIDNEGFIDTTGTFNNTAIGIINNTPGSGVITGATAPTFDITLSDGTTTLDNTTYTFIGEAAYYAPITPLTVTVTNDGNQVTSALTVTLSGGTSSNFTVNPAAISSIPVDDGTGIGNNTATFTIAPNTGLSAGTYTETVTVSGNNGVTATFDVSFTVAAADYSISLSQTGTYTFAGAIENYTTAPSLTVTVTNTGNEDTGALAVALSGTNPAAFAVTPSSFTDIAVGDNNTFTVTPNTGLGADTYTATITVSGDNGIMAAFDVSFTVTAASYSISLSDESTTPATALDGTTYTFPMQTAGYTAAPLTVTVTNTGNQPTGALTVTLSGGTSSNFTVTQITPAASLAVSGTGTFTAQPNAGLPVGTYTETVTVTDGNNITTTFDVTFTVADYGVSLSQTGTYTFTSLAENYAPVTPLTVTVTNTGTQPTGMLTVALTSGASFTLDQSTISTIAVSGSDTFTIVPKDGLTAGVYTDTVTVSGGNGITAAFDVSFTVTAATYGISLSQTGTYTFTEAIEGYAPVAPLTVTVTNTGNQPTGALTVALTSGTSFTLDKTTIPTLAVSGNDSFTVAPNDGLTAGIYTDTITVSGSNGITASFDVSFTVDPTPTYGITLDPSTDKDFGSVTEGYGAQAAYSVTVTNTGNQPTGDLTVALSGTNAEDFTLSATTIASIAVSDSDSFTIAPDTGLAVGTYTATVTVSGDSNITAVSFDVSFTVEAAPTYGIALSPDTAQDFGTLTVGYTTAPTASTITVSNTGNQPTGVLTVVLSGTNADSFTLSASTIASIAVNDSDSFTVAPNTGLAVGVYQATVTVSGGSNITAVSFDVSFTVEAAATYGIALSPDTTQDFGTLTVGYTTAPTASTITVSNTGNQPTGALTVALSGTNADSFTLSTLSIGSIAVSDSDSFTVVPNTGLAVGVYTATVTVSGGSNITATSFDVSFTVEAAPTYGIALSPDTTQNFRTLTVGYTTAPTASTITVSNTGTQPTGALTVALSGTDAGSFTLSTSTIGSIAVDGSDSFTVAPNTGLAVGVYTATVTVSGESNITAVSFDVSFTVEAAPTYGIALSPDTTQDFGTLTVGYTTAPTASTITVTNTGNQPTGALTVVLSGTNADSFTLSALTIGSIAVSGSDSFTVVPNTGLATGVYQATVTVSGGSNITAVSFDVSFTVEAATYGIVLSPSTTQNFGTLTVGYTTAPTARTIAVNNTGNQPTGDLTVALSGTNADSFTLSALTIGSIAVDGGDNFTVAPNTGLAVGVYTATVTVSGDSNITAVSFDVSFTVEAATYGIVLSPSTTQNFGTLTVGYTTAPTASTITVTNTGNQPTGALTVVLSGTNADSFTLSTSTIGSIAVDGSDSFTVAPNTSLAVGVYTATVTVSGESNITAVSFDVSFTVEAATYGIALSPSTTQNFGTLTVGYTTAPTARTITVSNTGNQPTGALTVALSGTNADSFTLSTSTIGSIAVSGNDSFTVAPNTGLAVGVYQATVTVSGGSNITAVSFNISFTVEAATPTPPPTPPPVPVLPFRDIAGHWAEADGSIAFVYERGLMRGTSATTFAPNATLTRAMFVTILYRMEGEPAVAFSPVFADVAGGQWYSEAVVWAAQNGIVQGIGNGRFAPEVAVSREEIAVLLYRYAGFKGYSGITPSIALEAIFSDYHLVSTWAEDAMAWAVGNRFIIGSGGKCMPLDAATRAECAALLSRFISHYAG